MGKLTKFIGFAAIAAITTKLTRSFFKKSKSDQQLAVEKQKATASKPANKKQKASATKASTKKSSSKENSSAKQTAAKQTATQQTSAKQTSTKKSATKKSPKKTASTSTAKTADNKSSSKAATKSFGDSRTQKMYKDLAMTEAQKKRYEADYAEIMDEWATNNPGVVMDDNQLRKLNESTLNAVLNEDQYGMYREWSENSPS